MSTPSRRDLIATGAGVGLAFAAASAFAQTSQTSQNAQNAQNSQPETPPPPPADANATTAAPEPSPRSTPARRMAFTEAQAETARRILAEAPSHGIGSSSDPSPDDAASLRAAVITYARAQHGLRIATKDFDKNWGLKPAPYDAERELDFALAQDKLDDWFASLPPPFARYRTLRDGLAIYRKLAKAGGWKAIPAGPDLTLGTTGPRVAALRTRLAFEDEAIQRTRLHAPFDAPLAESLKRVQARHGVAPTGVAGAATIRALNISPAQRVRTIRANMERWRWMPRNQPVDRIEVNIAATTFDMYVDNTVTLHFLAAAGRPKDETPILASTIGSIVFNPAWHVPDSIAAKELFPKSRRDKGYFSREGFVLTRTDGGGTRLVQKPGPKNALGQIKFDFPNNYSVYLHDTPARAAFSRSGRSVSHGCVRLQKPVDLADRLLDANGDFPPERVQQTIDAAQTVRVPLAKPMPVELLYWTAFPEGPQLSFREDIYGWDGALLRLLDAGAPT